MNGRDYRIRMQGSLFPYFAVPDCFQSKKAVKKLKFIKKSIYLGLKAETEYGMI